VAVLAVGTEYSTGMIRTTLAAMPGRVRLLAAKAAVVTALILAAGVLAAAGSLLAGWLILPGHGFTRAHGFAPLTLADGPVLRATAGSVLYLALIGLLSLGAVTAVRDSAVAIGIVLGLLYLVPIVAAVVTNATVQRQPAAGRADDSGLDVQATTGLRHPAAEPVAGPGRAGRLGSRRAAGRRPAAAASRRMSPIMRYASRGRRDPRGPPPVAGRPEPGSVLSMTMQTRRLGRTETDVTILGYGAMELRGEPHASAIVDPAAGRLLSTRCWTAAST